MIEVVQSATFAKWLSKLDDRRARARIEVRIDRLALGNPGDVKIAVLLCGGTKGTQQADIRRAIGIANDWRD
ncbi:MAG TPA: type II toxin-antitoxin system RelE/ParE family toxin [Gammaproteobacteria bacterium]